jgi:hypothetical protein
MPSKESERARDKIRWAKKTPEEKLDKSYKRNYGITYTDAILMLEAQDHKCGCCGDPISLGRNTGVIDHDHESGELREIVCPPCNKMLGFSRDSETRLSLGIAYLRKHSR